MSYPEIVRSGSLALLTGLLSHENADIVIDVVEVVHELTDEDVGNEADDEEDEEANSEALKLLIEALVRWLLYPDFCEISEIIASCKIPFWSFWWII